jgi:hypothetical protein
MQENGTQICILFDVHYFQIIGYMSNDCINRHFDRFSFGSSFLPKFRAETILTFISKNVDNKPDRI